MEYIDIDLVNREDNYLHNVTFIGRRSLDRADTIVLAKANDALDTTDDDGYQSMAWAREIGGFVKLNGHPNRLIEVFENENAALTRKQWEKIASQPGGGLNAKVNCAPIVFNGYVFGLVSDPNDRDSKIMINLTHFCRLVDATTNGKQPETIVYLGYGVPVIDMIYRVHLAVATNKIENIMELVQPMLSIEKDVFAAYNQPSAGLECVSGRTPIEKYLANNDSAMDTDTEKFMEKLNDPSVMQLINDGIKNALVDNYIKRNR